MENKLSSGAVKRLGQQFKDYITSYTGTAKPESSAFSYQLQQIARGLGIGSLSFLLGCASFTVGSFPFGYALFLALREHIVFSYAGLITAALICRGFSIPLFLLYSFLFGARCVIGIISQNRMPSESSDKSRIAAFFNEPLIVRICIGAAAAVIIGIYRTWSGGFLYYDLFGTLFECAAVPVAVFLFYGVFGQARHFTVHYEAGMTALLFCAVYSLRPYSIIGISLPVVLCTLVALYVSKTGGILRGAFVGLVCGIACEAPIAAIYTVMAVLSGFFWNVNGIAAVAAGAVGAAGFAMYLQGFPVLRTLIPDIAVASVLFCPFVQLDLLPRLSYLNSISAASVISAQNATSAALAENQRKNSVLKLQALSNALSSLSDVFYNLSDRLRRPGIYEVRVMAEQVFDEKCAGCTLCGLCWKTEYAGTSAALDKLTRILHKGESVRREDVPPDFEKRCQSLDELVAKLNLNYAIICENTIKTDKTEIFASDYEALSKLLEEAATEGGENVEYVIDEKLTARVREAVRYMDFGTANICVYGSRRIQVLAGGLDLSRFHHNAAELRTVFENVCGVPLTFPQFCIDEDYITMSIRSARKINTSTAFATSKKDSERVNGDNITSFENREDYYYALISDGMGSGHEAALTSKLCCIFLEKLLSACNSKSLTLEMLNNFIRNKNIECFATVDLLEIDLLSGKASFIKSGAAPSYILRSGSLYKIASNTMPVGITREINAEEINFELMEDDTIILISDGIAQGYDDSTWLTEFITNEHEDNIQTLANNILAAAKQHSPRSDDMTVAVIKIL